MFVTIMPDEERTFVSDKDDKNRQQIPVGSRVRKQFGTDWFDGYVSSYDPKSSWYEITYEDGDMEECTYEEVTRILHRT